MKLFTSTVGRKILVAISGQLMVLFVIAHLLGNSSIFIPGGINAYAEHIHALPPLVWAIRFVMLVAAVVHIYFSIQLTLENRTANPAPYAMNRQLKATFSSKNMIWTGVLLGIFIIGHLLHFTFRVTPDIASRLASLSMGPVFDVYSMVVSSFRNGMIAAIYVVSMVILFLHLNHGIQAFFQTMGWNNDRSLPVISKTGKVIAIIFLVGYSSIPIFILACILT
ncbi:MAG TPA: succinate dehydrogenase cytochrome b subunit [Geobacteraceae bacterium]|nr:succinate dehydrogenase cytochrome b subunit [Geobacteraceae bacterium]